MNGVLLFTGFGDKSAYVKHVVSRNTRVPIPEPIDLVSITSPDIDDLQQLFLDKEIEKWFLEVTTRIWSSTLQNIPFSDGEECQFFDEYLSLTADMPQKIFHATMGQKNDAWLWYCQVRKVMQCNTSYIFYYVLLHMRCTFYVLIHCKVCITCTFRYIYNWLHMLRFLHLHEQ